MVYFSSPMQQKQQQLVSVVLGAALFLLLLCVNNGGVVVHCYSYGEKQVFKIHDDRNFPWNQENSKITPQLAHIRHKSRKQNGATILEIKHHFNMNRFESSDDKLRKIILSDIARASSLQFRIKNSFSSSKNINEEAATAQIPLASGAKLQTLNYVVEIEINGQKVPVIVDTGSDLTWIQCKPCFFCYNQQNPLFDPSNSSSYKNIPCNSSACSLLQSGVCGVSSNSCNYALSYGDGSYTSGVLAQDSVNLGGTKVENFVFGCGRNNRGLFGEASGLVGLGRTQLSLVTQTLELFQGVFSYCLPSKLFNSSGSLVFGEDSSAYKNATPVTYTTMVSTYDRVSPFYYLNVTSISVGGVPVRANGFSTGKFLIDSGTVITRLPPSIYTAVKNEFLKQFLGFASAPGFAILDTCFNLSGYDEVKIPTLKFEFGTDVEVSVDVSGMLYFVKADASQVCLALASLSDDDEVGIVGNYQQKNLRVVYDTVGSRLGFAEEICGYS